MVPRDRLAPASDQQKEIESRLQVSESCLRRSLMRVVGSRGNG